MNAKMYETLAKTKKLIDRGMLAVGSAGTALTAMAVNASASGDGAESLIDVSSVDFSGLTSSITSMVPQVLPVAVTIIGIRKALSFMMGTIRGC